LGPEYQTHGVADGHHASNARFDRYRKASGLEAVAVADDDCTIAHGKSAILDTGERIGVGQGRGRAARFVPRDVSTLRQGFDGASEQLRRELALTRRLGAAVHAPFERHFSEHHLWVAGVVFVDRNRPVRAVDHLKPAPGMTLGLRAGRALAKEQNIRGDFRSRIALERGVGQPYRAQQVGMFGQMPADDIGLLVHGVAARDEHHHAAAPQFLQRLGEEVIMNRARQLRLHRGVMDGVIAK
jgi:hypothetical protein